MPLFYELSYVDDQQPLEQGNPSASGSVASGAASSAVAHDGVVTVTATEDGYVAIGASVTAAASDPRRRVINGVQRSFVITKGDKVGFTAG